MEQHTLAKQRMTLRIALRLLRAHQWVKNAFVFFPAFFAEVILHPDVLFQTTIGFVCFSLAASAIYMFNDLRDVEQDRMHPVKKKRPIAAGEVSLALVPWLSVSLATVALVGSWFLSPRFALVLGGYMVMNVAYSLRLKHVPILDVTIIALGFLFRVHAGGILAHVPVSHWIELITLLVALFIALAKRRDDLVQVTDVTSVRKSLKGYSLPFVDASMIMLASVVIQSYIMYTVSPEVIDRIGTDKLYATSIFVVLGMMRYFQLTLLENRSGSPVKLIFTDLPIQLILLGWILSFGIILYAF